MAEHARMRKYGLCLAMAVLALALPASGAATPAVDGAARPAPTLAIPLHEAIYHATVRRIPVRAGLRLEQQSDGLYVYRSWVEPRGILGFVRRDMSEASLVMLDRDGEIVPVSYRRRDELGGRHSDMRFDLAQGELHIEYRGQKSTIDWEPGIYDLLSLRLALVNDLARGTLRDTYRVVDDRSRVEEVEVEVAGRETLVTPLGELDTIRLEYRNPRRDRSFKLWVAPELDTAMVRLEQHEDGRLRGTLHIVEYRRL